MHILRAICESRYSRTILHLLDVFIIFSLLVVPVAWFLDPLEVRWGGMRLLRAGWSWRVVATPLVLTALRSLFAGGVRRWSAGAPTPLASVFVMKMFLAVASSMIFLLAGEAALARIDFKLLTSPIIITGEDRKLHDDSRGLLGDPILRWKYNPGAMFRGRKVNKLGFLDREVEAVKPAGMKRVICMGCSCTAQGPRSYSEILNDLLQRTPPTSEPWEAFNMGVHGYSAVLGLRLFQKRGLDLAPDVVTMYFGWNDHWESGYWPDSHGVPLQFKAAQGVMVKRLFLRRVVQYAAFRLSRTPLPVSIRGQVVLKDAQKFGKCLRVSAKEYRETLTTFIAEIRRAGAIPILITAPRAATLTPLLVAQGQTSSVAEAIKLHDEYVGIVREVARTEKAALLDLAASVPPLEKFRTFGDDGIHLTLEGRQWVAEQIHALLLRELGGSGSRL